MLSNNLLMFIDKCDSVLESTLDTSRFKIIPFGKDKSIDEYLKKDRECSRYLNTLHKTSAGEVIIDTIEDRIAGYVFVFKYNKKNNGFIYNVYVYPKYRQNGLGNILIKDAIAKYGGIDLTVGKTNTKAINLYKKHGFKIKGDGNSDKEYWMSLDGK